LESCVYAERPECDRLKAELQANLMQTITVAGAGFSGLTTAFFLTKKGCKVRVVEKTVRPGGLIRTIHTEHGLVETAANGLLNSVRLQEMCAAIGVSLMPTRREGRKRFIYRGRPRQVPLKVSELLATGARVAAKSRNLKPLPLESIAKWGNRVLGAAMTDYLVTPALGGIYAGDPNCLSASLIFGRAQLPPHLSTNRPAKARLRGTVAPPKGMQQLIESLYEYLKNRGVEFAFNYSETMNPAEPVIVCLSANAAGNYLQAVAPKLGEALQSVEMLSLATVTCFYPPDAAKVNGFGCLFPRDQNYRARGVLFNDSIFEGRGPAHAETWIFGGALDPEVVNLTDDQVSELIADERERFYGVRNDTLAVHITRWRNALPHYSLDLERTLTTLPPPPRNVALVGNYLGRIGLAKILERAAFVAEEFGSSLC